MASVVGRGVKRVAAVLALAVAVLAGLSVVVAVVPRTLLPVYLGGWILVIVPVMLKHSEIASVRRAAREPPYSSFLSTAEVLAIFGFGLITFQGLMNGALPTLLAGLVGVLVAVYDLSG